MGYEIDFLAVGDGEKSGDAIAIRYGNLFGSRDKQTVVVIDGGTKNSGQRLVEHIQTHYQADWVDLVICTHPDSDHASGLSVVLEKMKVGRLWMHRPWSHTGKIRDAFADGRHTNDSLSGKLEAALGHAKTLEDLALGKGIPITEPFSDNGASSQVPGLIVLGPSTTYYRELLPQFDCLPATKSLEEGFLGRFSKSFKSVFEGWGWETLSDPTPEEETSPTNNSSAIILLRVEGRDLLFTGDVGVAALGHAADEAGTWGIDLRNCAFQQIPHHGSRRNVGPTILNRIVGARGTLPDGKEVVVSASSGGAPKHPAKKVTNAYQRRGAKVSSTQGKGVLLPYNAPERWGWGAIAPLPFYNEVEE